MNEYPFPYYLEHLKDKYILSIGEIDYFKFDNERCNSFIFGIKFESNCFFQGFGGYALDQYSEKLKRRIGSSAGHDLLIKFQRMFNVDNLYETKGKKIYAIYNKEHKWNDPIVGIARLSLDIEKNLGDENENRKYYVLIPEWQEDIKNGVYNEA